MDVQRPPRPSLDVSATPATRSLNVSATPTTRSLDVSATPTTRSLDVSATPTRRSLDVSATPTRRSLDVSATPTTRSLNVSATPGERGGMTHGRQAVACGCLLPALLTTRLLAAREARRMEQGWSERSSLFPFVFSHLHPWGEVEVREGEADKLKEGVLGGRGCQGSMDGSEGVQCGAISSACLEKGVWVGLRECSPVPSAAPALRREYGWVRGSAVRCHQQRLP
ncbi:unnamed protein product [Closterium sp. Naga37s-1]|nr:unnamed protein product [Closterium sp. Naga37s-1]